MKKVAIYTIVSENLGNKLQNYAMQQILEDMGYRVKTIRREPYPTKTKAKNFVRSFIKKDRFTNYFLFSRHIKWDNDYLSKDHIPSSLQDRYDYFVIGSDQIWNPTFPFSSEVDYLPFVPSSKIVAFSASFGLDKIPEPYTEDVKKGLQHVGAVSVREESGARIVEELTGKKAEVVLDPTLMLSAQKWLELARKPENVECDKAFILTYFLGGKSDEVRCEVERIAKENNLLVFNLLDSSQQQLFKTGPSEFLYLISRSSLVLTDSFHACVFSYIFKKPFLVYPRGGKGVSMMSRIDTLLKKLNIQRKYVNSGLKNDLFEADYEISFKVLAEEQKKAIAFLKAAMKS